jgi:hypothetical protein
MQTTGVRDSFLSPASKTIENRFTAPHQLPDEIGEPDMTEAAQKHPAEEKGREQPA